MSNNKGCLLCNIIRAACIIESERMEGRLFHNSKHYYVA